MNDETIYENQELKDTSDETTKKPQPENPNPVKKKGISGGAAAGIAGGAAVAAGAAGAAPAGIAGGAAVAAGAAGAAAAVLMPKYVFPYVKDIARGAKDLLGDAKDFIGGYFNHGDDAVIDDDNLLTVETPTVSDQLVGHDMDVASGVNDSMSFNEAFAAARHELGAGGLFVWHGNTYGTYYANEWNAMTPEQHDQYWADVQHTTSTIEYDPMDDSVLTNDMADADEVVVDVDMEEPGDLEEVEVDDLAEVEVDPNIDPDDLGDTAFLVESDEMDDLAEAEVNVDFEEGEEIEMADTFAVEMSDSDIEAEGLLGDEMLEDSFDADITDVGGDDMMLDDSADLNDLV